MGSLYLSNLSQGQITDLEGNLWKSQNGICFICGKEIDLKVQKDAIDIDHIIPIKTGGRDDESNFALTHSHCNRSKQASDLRVARVLARFDIIREECAITNRGPNLNDKLKKYGGAKYDLSISIEEKTTRYSFGELEDTEIYNSPIYKD